ncbi:2-amino-4-hydroxy-6-hydroxymethyldihydropteridine diphosphokinase [Agromyces italicus]|uniref:2-amino-4-hydroxy-6- hydroxymethyldihydropteridine diphosphokinase n=1 Tax=Agromyces italicus TaxID=279572 RepID=UPI0004116291|nr:2-amino-4-hydroxy-6-hydroxymethyldihydropteridine diphosphokinase [Agromyces italicus]
MSRAVIAFGANLGDREQTLADAARALADADGVELLAVSPLYETPALKTTGVDHDAPGYLNGVFLVETVLEPHALLDVLQGIETAQGRVRAERWGDRTLDLDLIDIDGLELADARLELPHPRAWQRAFVLAPWLDVDPDAVLPGRGPVAALRAEASDEVVRR